MHLTLITASPSDLPGIVRTLTLYSKADFPVGSLVLCRNTAPLVRFAYELIRQDLPCCIAGKDIGDGLIKLVEKVCAVDFQDLRDKLSLWLERQTLRATGEGRSPEFYEDQYACLMYFMEDLQTHTVHEGVYKLTEKIQRLFTNTGDPGTRITLSTIHRAKGSEYPVVFILDRALIPSGYATQTWQLEQERNLLYVAITRAMRELYYIASGSWREEKHGN